MKDIFEKFEKIVIRCRKEETALKVLGLCFFAFVGMFVFGVIGISSKNIYAFAVCGLCFIIVFVCYILLEGPKDML